ncbi:multicomponent Na+:H+ antiporter subunit D [Olivibacter domesticus]|uniref:Multicomponent Na+:H+ antiporter subunit D n=2 Tax=Olivibacter domesticus TaxID=407022 RepID=A0A1H7PUL4_OLID1|nr:multicomponent Na+:H+ antiporter subunit D [Olivibacter domesticus]
MLSGMLCLLFNKYVKVQRFIAVAGSLLAFVFAVMLVSVIDRLDTVVMQLGGWEAPFGITLFVDRLAALLLCITALLALAVSVFSFAEDVLSSRKKRIGFYPAFLFMLAGISGAFLTGDLFNLYVWFEVMLISSFVLITLGSKKDQLQGGIKYVVINFVASSFLLLAIGILYGTTGNTNLAALSESLRDPSLKAITQLAAVLLLVSFGIKSALFPFYFWLPSSYHTPPIAITAIIAGLLTKVGVYTLIRTFTLLFPLQQHHLIQQLILVLSCITMIIGVLGAINQQDIRKILAFNLISKIGFMVFGLAVYTPIAICGAIFYMLHHILVKTNLFFVAGIIGKIAGSYEVKKIKGLYDHFSLLSFLFMILSLTLVGIPPFSGFWGKFMLVDAGLKVKEYLPISIMLVTSLLTLYSMMLIWKKCFLSEYAKEKQQLPLERVYVKKHYHMYLASVFLLLITLWISFSPTWLIDYTRKAAEQVLQPANYINAVLKK